MTPPVKIIACSLCISRRDLSRLWSWVSSHEVMYSIALNTLRHDNICPSVFTISQWYGPISAHRLNCHRAKLQWKMLYVTLPKEQQEYSKVAKYMNQNSAIVTSHRVRCSRRPVLTTAAHSPANCWCVLQIRDQQWHGSWRCRQWHVFIFQPDGHTGGVNSQ